MVLHAVKTIVHDQPLVGITMCICACGVDMNSRCDAGFDVWRVHLQYRSMGDTRSVHKEVDPHRVANRTPSTVE